MRKNKEISEIELLEEKSERHPEIGGMGRIYQQIWTSNKHLN